MFKPKKMPLPTGRGEFMVWASRIMNKAKIAATTDSQLFVLANVLMNNVELTKAHETDEFFVNCLKKYAANQVADTIRTEARERTKAPKEAEKAQSEVLPIQAV